MRRRYPLPDPAPGTTDRPREHGDFGKIAYNAPTLVLRPKPGTRREQLDDRRSTAEDDQWNLYRPEEPPAWEKKQTERALEAARVALWSWNVENNRFGMDERGFELWQLPPGENVTFEDLSSRIHPADRDRVRAAFLATRSVAGFYETDFRIILDEQIKWISSRGLGADAGIHERLMFGVFLDVTARKQAEEASELLAGEMSHRVKNLPRSRPASPSSLRALPLRCKTWLETLLSG